MRPTIFSNLLSFLWSRLLLSLHEVVRAQVSTVAPVLGECSLCFVIAPFTEIAPGASSTMPGITSTGAPSAFTFVPGDTRTVTTYFIFSDYIPVSAMLLNGVCITITGPTVTFNSASYAVPIGEDPEVFLTTAESSIIAKLGLATCQTGQGEAGETPTSYVTVTNITLTSFTFSAISSSIRSATASLFSGISVNSSTISTIIASRTLGLATEGTSETTVPTASEPAISPVQGATTSGTAVKIGVGVAVPIFVIALLAIGNFFWRKHQKSRATTSATPITQRSELEGKDKSHELPGKESRHELRTVERSQELAGADIQRHELEANGQGQP